MALLKTVIIGMAVMIVGALALLAYGLVTRIGGETVTDAKPVAPNTIIVPDAAGCQIRQAQRDGSALVLTLGGPATCQRVVIVDLATGALSAQIRLSPAQP